MKISRGPSNSRFSPLKSYDSGTQKAHGRIERRTIDVLPVEAADIQRDWPTVRQICRVRRVIQRNKEGDMAAAIGRNRLSHHQLV